MGEIPVVSVIPSRVWVYTAILAVICVVVAYFQWDARRQGRLDDQETRLEHEQIRLRHEIQESETRLQIAKAAIHRADDKGTVAQAHRLQAQSKVQILGDTLVRISSDTGAREERVPPEMIILLRADSAVIAVDSARLAARDTALLHADSVITETKALAQISDSVAAVLRQQRPSKWGAVLKVVTVAGALRLGLWALLGK